MKINNYSELVKLADDYEIISFDIFDTLVYRKFLGLDEIQVLSAKFLQKYVNGDSADFRRIIFLRSHISNLLKDSFLLNTQEPNLNQVFSRIVSGNGLSGKDLDDAIHSCVEFEFNIDRLNIASIPGAAECLVELKSKNKKIIAISDMYFTQEQVQTILEQNNLMKYIDRLYVSSSHKKTKQTTDLYRFVVDDLKVDASDVMHIGDNFSSDYLNANKVGKKGFHFTHKIPTPVCKNNDEYIGPDIISMITRLSICFVCNLLLECHRLKIEKIFFLSRDATVFLNIANQLLEFSPIINRITSEIKLKELHLSRAATAFLSLSRQSTLKEILGIYLWVSGGQFRLRQLLDFFAIEFEEIHVEEEYLETKVDKNSIKSVEQELISRHVHIVNLIIESAKRHAQTTIEYLLQEGVIGSGKVALVDLGYTSTSTRQLATFLHKEAADEVRANTEILDFLLIEGPKRADNYDFSCPFTSSYNEAIIPFRNIPIVLRGNFSWFECFFADRSRGPLLGYNIDQAGKFTGNFKYEQRTYDQPVVLECSKILNTISQDELLIFFSSSYLKDLSINMFKEFKRPNPETLEFIRKLHQGIGVIETRLKTIIKEDIGLKDFTLNNYRDNMAEEIWYTGSLAFSNKKYLYPLFFTLKLALMSAKKTLKSSKKAGINLRNQLKHFK